MEAIMVSALSGATGSLLGKLAALLEGDLKLAQGAKKAVVTMRDEISSMDALLKKLSTQLLEEEPVDAQLRELRCKARELAYNMEDCVDIAVHRLGGGGSGNSKAAGLLHHLKTLGARYETATLIGALKARVVELDNRCNHIIQLPAERPRAVRVDPRIQALYAEASSLEGIQGPRQKLVELLQDGAPQLKVVSVVGFGGIGKTTLANQVYTAIQGQYDCTAFVSVSQIPNLARVFSDIIKQIRRGYYSANDDENQLVRTIREHLKDKRYLIVIDDIWTNEAWNIIKCCLVENNCGSRVITTTRIEETAKACCSNFHDWVYRIKPLNDLDSRRLFYRRIFHSEDACPKQLQSISDEILKKCGGLPLAILTIGSILATHHEVCSVEIWENILSSFRFQLETSPDLGWMRHVLNLGYNDLSLDLKTCFLYLGIFPEDHRIPKDELLRRWIAEGFVTEKHGCCQEEVAEWYLNELINRNMIQIAGFDDCGEVFACQLHDLMLDYIILKSTEENFITIIDDQHSTKGPLDVRRLSLHVRNLKPNDVLGNMSLTQARSFNLWAPAQCMPSLKKFRLLRVLHLDIYCSNGRMYEMSSVSSLFQLRYLRTRGILCKKLLRTQLRNLEQLRTLEVDSEREYFNLDARMLPSRLWHLNLPQWVKLVGGIGGLRELRTLCGFEIYPRDVESMEELGKLTNLRELKLYRWFHRYGDTCEVLHSSLCKLSNLRSLIIQGDVNLDNDSLARWSPPPRHLRRLHVLESPFSTVPSDWITQLDNLSSLEILVRSLPSDGASILARLTLLVHLKLHVEEHIPREGVVVFRRAVFPNLRDFWFRWESPCLAFEEGAMPSLRSLVIDCHEKAARQSDGVLDGIEHLGSLLDLKVHVYERQDFFSRSCESFNVSTPSMEMHQRWDGTSLEAAFKEAISKHPGSIRVVIETV